MKNLKMISTIASLIPAAMLLASCGSYQKDPVSKDELQNISAEAKAEAERSKEAGTNGPTPTPTPTPPEKQIVYVDRPVQVVHEQATVDGKFLVITPDPQMTFTEGQSSSFKIKARVLVPGLTLTLKATNLPQGAELKNISSTTEPDTYSLTWTPALYTVPDNQPMKSVQIKFSADIAGKDADKYKSLVTDKDATLFVFKNLSAPTDLTVVGLASEIAEGTQTPFTVTVKVAGIDGQATQKPRLMVTYDGVSYTVGNSFLELDGSRYVTVAKKDAEYVGDSQWKFSLTYDTKNISVQPQLAKDGSFISNADGLRVRLSFKAYSPAGLSTAETVKQIKIKYAKAGGPQVATPEKPAAQKQAPAAQAASATAPQKPDSKQASAPAADGQEK
jgi:hypothetical protein